MRHNKLCFLSILLFFFVSCKKEPLKLEGISIPEFMTTDNEELSNSTFFIGPELDSAKVDIVADCDCCAGNLAFINDSSFLYIELCLGGNSYIKGDYLVLGDLLILRTNKESISEEYEVGSMEVVPTKYEVIKQNPDYLMYKISDLKGKQVITYSKDDYTEYGMRDSGSADWFMKEWRKEKALKEYLKNI